MHSATKFVILMHPHEVKRVKVNTGRFTALSFQDAEILVGVGFVDCTRLRELVADPAYYPVLLYPRTGAANVSKGELGLADLGGRRLLVIVVDATWALAKKMVKLSPILQRLPALMFTPSVKSRWTVKRQPDELCLSTLESVHCLMLALEQAGLDRYERPDQLLTVFTALNEFQVACANDPAKRNYRNRSAYTPQAGRTAKRSGKSARSLFWRDNPDGPKPEA